MGTASILSFSSLFHKLIVCFIRILKVTIFVLSEFLYQVKKIVLKISSLINVLDNYKGVGEFYSVVVELVGVFVFVFFNFKQCNAFMIACIIFFLVVVCFLNPEIFSPKIWKMGF